MAVIGTKIENSAINPICVKDKVCLKMKDIFVLLFTMKTQHEMRKC